jgi:hypothetical protein
MKRGFVETPIKFCLVNQTTIFFVSISKIRIINVKIDKWQLIKLPRAFSEIFFS